MGKGLACRKKGTHIGFSAGVSVIYFLDLVTHLARKHMGLLTETEEKMLDPEFKFVFFASFADEKSSVALSYMRAVHRMSKESDKDFFEL